MKAKLNKSASNKKAAPQSAKNKPSAHSKHTGRGGARQGAGRPSFESEARSKTLSVRASPATIAKLCADCERLNLSQAEYLHRLIKKGL